MKLITLVLFAWLAAVENCIAPKFASNGKQKKGAVTAAAPSQVDANSAAGVAQAAAQPAATTMNEALDRTLSQVPKSAAELVKKTTILVFNVLHGFAKQRLTLGEECGKVQEAISKPAFIFWVNTTLVFAGAKMSSILRWIGQAKVLMTLVPYSVAREAIIAVTDGNGLFGREDGNYVANGAFIQAITKNPAPEKGSYEDCLDWARQIEAVLSKVEPEGKTGAEIYKAAVNVFDKLLKKNHAYAVQFVVACYRVVFAYSEPLASAIQTGITERDIDLAAIGRMAVKELEDARKAAKEAEKQTKQTQKQTQAA